MSDEKLTHWKKMVNSQWLGSWDLDEGKEVLLTIDRIEQEEVQNSTGKPELCPIAYFKDVPKGMVLNRTNMKQIEKIAESPYIEKWLGVQVQIGISEVSAFGQTILALRIRNKKTGRKEV